MCENETCKKDGCEIPYGLCHCGCGGRPTISKETRPRNGWIRGIPRLQLRGHHLKSGAEHPAWKGGRYTDERGYVLISLRGHPMANANGYVQEHRLVVAEREGRMLTREEVVHHINGIRTDNRSENLELLESNAAHMQLHGRQWAEQGVRPGWERPTPARTNQ